MKIKKTFGSNTCSINSVVGAGRGGDPVSRVALLSDSLLPLLSRTASGTFAFSKSFYDDTTVTGGAGGDTLAGGGGNDTVAGGSGGGNPPANGGDKKFTQADLDRIAAKERREWQEKLTKKADELETLRKTFTGTDEQKKQLEAKIEELRTASLTKEQQLQRQLEKEKKEKEEAAKTLQTERDTWHTRHNSLLVRQALSEASAANDAFSPIQIIDLLFPRSKVVEVKDSDGNSTGEYKVAIKFDDVDAKTKQPVTLELDPDAALKRMKELPDRFGNLFKSNLNGGVGKSKTTAAGEPDVSAMSTEEYMAHRRKLKQGK